MSDSAIDLLPDFISLELTADLVAQGRRAPWLAAATVGAPETFTAAVLDASNTSPIVVTADPRSLGVIDFREGRVLHVVIAGVLGNTAVNKIDDAKDQRNEAWYAVVTSAEQAPTVTLALYDLNRHTGELVASVGNGAYAGGGTISKGLVDGRVRVGREHITEQSSAPRVVMVPLKFPFGPVNASSAWTQSVIDDGEAERQDLARPIRSMMLTYEVHVWARSTSTYRSFGGLQKLVEDFVRAVHSRFGGVYELGGGDVLDQHEDAPQRCKFGHEAIFTVGLSVPITDTPVTYAPPALDVALDLSVVLAGGPPEAL